MKEKSFFSHKFRQRRQNTVNNDPCRGKTRSVLFVLDTSGSIGRQSFQRMTAAISNLTTSFCDPVQFALMTFNDRRWLEFCFNCFNNSYIGRNNAKQAISNVVYRSGLTYTGSAARCACEELLSYQKCGLSRVSCIDVVFITDGLSNGPLDVCEEVKCLHNNDHRIINTYAMGINNYVEAEIRCIAKYSNIETVFRFESFDEFHEYMNNVTTRMFNLATKNIYSCLNRDRTLSTMKP